MVGPRTGRTPLILLNQLFRSPLNHVSVEAVSPSGAPHRRPVGPSRPREPRTKPGAPSQPVHPSLAHYDPARHHVAVTLSPKSKQRLLNGVPPKHANVQGDHVTIVPPGQHLTDEHKKALSKHIGQQVNFHVTHRAANDEIEAGRVRGLNHLSNKPDKHVTIGSAHGVPAVRSNNLLKNSQGERLSDWIPLTGTVHVVDRMAR
jgi:hypothetical protein